MKTYFRQIITRPRARIAAIVFLWFVLLLGIFHSAHLYSNDTALKLRSARNLLTKGTTAVEPCEGGWGSRSRDGIMYPNFVIGSILAMIPPVVVTEILSVFLDDNFNRPLLSAVVSTQNLLITAVAMTISFLILQKWGIAQKKSLGIAIILLFSTEFFTYSSTGWSEPAALLSLLTGVLFMGKPDDSDRAWAGFSLAIFITGLIRIEYILFSLIFLLIISRTHGYRKRLIIWPLVSLVACLTVHLGYNMYRFGSLLDFGYFTDSAQSGSQTQTASLLLRAVTRLNFTNFSTFSLLYLSFGRLHPFWSAPVIVALPFYLKGITKNPPIIRTLFISAVLFFPFTQTNSWCWANRYVFLLIPFLLIPMVFGKPLFKGASIVLSVCVIAGLCISFGGKLINYHVVLEQQVREYGYTDVMWVRAHHFTKAPFWAHAEKLPATVARTVALPFSKAQTYQWQLLRAKYLDIWPVGLIAVGVSPSVAFSLWLIWVCVAFVYTVTVLKRHLNH